MVRVCVNTELFSSSPFSFVCLTLNRLLKTKNRGCETCGCVYRDGVSVPQYKNALKKKRNKLFCEGLRPAFLCLTFLWSSPESWAGSFFSSPPPTLSQIAISQKTVAWAIHPPPLLLRTCFARKQPGRNKHKSFKRLVSLWSGNGREPLKDLAQNNLVFKHGTKELWARTLLSG